MVVTLDVAPSPPGDFQVVRRGNALVNSARISSEHLYLSGDLHDRLGKPRFATVLTSAAHAAIGIRAGTRKPGSAVLKVCHVSGGTVAISSTGTLKRLRRRAVKGKTSPVPHRWVGDTLIVDVSSLPVDREG